MASFGEKLRSALSVIGFAFTVLLATEFTDAGDEFTLTTEGLQRAIESRTSRIEEFRVLREWGIENKVRIFGAGGTATGLAVYVRQALENEWRKARGLVPKYFEGRFTYNYFDAFRSTQDADIVIDGTEAQAEKLENFLHERFPYLQGSKSVWEVRLLNQSRGTGDGEKFPLLGFDFQNQNTDTFSTGIIELTDPPAGESRVRDLREWTNKQETRFLKNVTEGKIKFLRSPKHAETKFAISGANPEIQSVIRFLTKAFQYEAEISIEDEREIREIIDAFDSDVRLSAKATKDISKNGQKLFWHSPDVERAWNYLEKVGLRQKLVQFGKRNNLQDLHLWLNKEPLRHFPLGTVGQSAAELGIDFVAHDTRSYVAYENMTRSLSGRPNVFISRRNTPGEEAWNGEGFYTMRGRQGGVGGIAIGYRVNPNARLGHDFDIVDNQVIVRNAAMLETIEDSLNITPEKYFELLARRGLGRSDEGLIERMRIKQKLASLKLSPEVDGRLSRLVLRDIAIERKLPSKSFSPLIKEWLNLPAAKSHPEILDQILKYYRFAEIVRFSVFVNAPSFGTWIGSEINATHLSQVIHWVLNNPAYFFHPDYDRWYRRSLEVDYELTVRLLIGGLEFQTHPHFFNYFEEILAREPRWVIDVLASPKFRTHPKSLAWFDAILERRSPELTAEIFRSYGISHHPSYDQLVLRGLETDLNTTLAKAMASSESFRLPGYESWMRYALQLDPAGTHAFLLNNRYTASHPKFGRWIVDLARRDPTLDLSDLLARTNGRNSDLLERICPGNRTVECVRQRVTQTRQKYCSALFLRE